jgi:uroporphyrinogen decarboxylase
MLNHQEPDWVPIAFGGPSCAIHRQAHDNLLEFLGYAAGAAAPTIDRILQIVAPDERLCERFDVDVMWLIPEEGPVVWGPDRQSYVDDLGRAFKLGGGFFNQVASPLRAGTPEELAGYRFPDLRGDPRAAGLGAQARRLYTAGYGLATDGPWGLYEYCSTLRGPAEFFMDMVLNPDYVETLAERVLEEHLLPYYTLMLNAVGEYVQMVGISDDYGSQTGLLFAPAVFRRLFKPRLRRLVEHIRRLTDVRIYIHSDGAVADLIPDFIEIGIDGLNPVQYTAKGMEAVRLKQEFGNDFGFFGGGIDNEVLSYGTAEEVRRDARQQIRALAPGGGYLYATIHNMPPEVPPQNVAAFFDAGREFGQYPII